mmetsp:Transcript_36792/g.89308  ORF Transcript_36792/g.89308 Transcript_36792/m.89308 type:complete len:236 (+) Transcript_36792:851-1558(+)
MLFNDFLQKGHTLLDNVIRLGQDTFGHGRWHNLVSVRHCEVGHKGSGGRTHLIDIKLGTELVIGLSTSRWWNGNLSLVHGILQQRHSFQDGLIWGPRRSGGTRRCRSGGRTCSVGQFLHALFQLATDKFIGSSTEFLVLAFQSFLQKEIRVGMLDNILPNVGHSFLQVLLEFQQTTLAWDLFSFALVGEIGRCDSRSRDICSSSTISTLFGRSHVCSIHQSQLTSPTDGTICMLL